MSILHGMAICGISDSVHPVVGIDPVSGLSPDSSAFRKRAPRVQLSSDPDTATVQTVQEMCREVHQAAKDPLVISIARRAVRTMRGGPVWWSVGPVHRDSEPHMMADSAWWWCKHALKFRHHGDMFEVWSGDLGDPRTKLQLLIAPDMLVRMRQMEGDCAIYTMMVCAMLEALGVQWQICPAAVNHATPEIFSHVFARAVFPDGSTESLDASHGKYPGWQVPQQDLLRLWVFDQNGNRVSESRQGFSGLHDYRPRRGMRGSAYRGGMGTMVCDDSGCFDDGTGTNVTTGTEPSPYYNPTQVFGPGIGTPPYIDSSNVPYSGPVSVAPSQNSAQWASFAASLAKSGLTLAEINSIQPGTVVGANGSILRQNPGYAVPVGSTLGTSLSSFSSSSVLAIALGLGALLIVGSMFKGGR